MMKVFLDCVYKHFELLKTIFFLEVWNFGMC